MSKPLGCQTLSTGGFNYGVCPFLGGSVTQTQPFKLFVTSGWTAKLGTVSAWNGTAAQYVFGNGQACGVPSTPRQGTITLKCTTSSPYVKVYEKTLYTPTGQVACLNCCNYDVQLWTNAAC